eukprot:CAMPEP_0117660982 /NCGR_PEP_ID=MMETSP0804-20121206/7286_1 /TAXON_ID=1074897 /ORGANISM="Tetraselmis astigmatica, Strain CCMP880" /LENGTH=56 /DNA_ID=CAMNT_0005467803 /DNA_START=178 /DNA_END=344 /DNA_ORIENTATION=-
MKRFSWHILCICSLSFMAGYCAQPGEYGGSAWTTKHTNYQGRRFALDDDGFTILAA